MEMLNGPPVSEKMKKFFLYWRGLTVSNSAGLSKINFRGRRWVRMEERKCPKRQTIIDRTVRYMKDLGTYKVQYKQVIEIYADMIYQYNYLSREFERSEFETTVETEKSAGKKSPILVSLENLRKDIGTYSDRLMLNAKTYNAEIEKPKEEESVVAAFLKKQKGK